MQWTLILGGAVAGLFAHHGLFIWGEWHLAAPRVIFGHVALSAIAWWYPLRHESAMLLEHTRLCLYFFASYIISLFTSIVLYRLFFHRLRGFPGPKFAAASKLWHVFKTRHGNNFQVLENMRQQYGNFVRTGKPSTAYRKSHFSPDFIDMWE